MVIIIIITIITYHNKQNSRLPHVVEVVVHFILVPWLMFLDMVMYDNEFETKEKKI